MWGGGPGRKETHANWPPWPISLAKRSPPVFALARVVERAPQVLVNAHWAASMVTDLADARGWRRSWACAPVVVRAGAAIEMKRTHKQATAVCLHPGTVETDFTAKYAGRHKTVPAPQAAAHLVRVIEGLGPAQTGRFFDYAGREIPW